MCGCVPRRVWAVVRVLSLTKGLLCLYQVAQLMVTICKGVVHLIRTREKPLIERPQTPSSAR
jgi:hypothetical protein